MSSFPLTLLGGIVVGVGQAQMSRYVHSPGWSSAVPFLLILVVLAFRGRGLLSRPGVEERRPGIGPGRIRVIPLLIACATVVVAVYAGLSTEYVSAIALTFAVAVILLSTVVVTGYAGQLSLCQFTFAGFGAWFAGMFFTRVGMPYLAALVLAVILAFPLGFVVGLPALRTRGIQLAVATLGVAAAVQSVLWLNYDLTGQSGFPIRNPTLFGIEIDTFDHPKNYAVVCVVGFLVAVVAVSNLRRGASGRRLIALRSNERAAAANGINPYVAKLYAFALSSSIAAFGGVLFEFRNTTLVYDSGFDPFSSITGLLYVVLGGVGQLSGPIVGAVGQPAGVIQTAIGGGGNVPLWIAVVGGILTARALADAPNGAAALFGTIWHKVVKLVPRVFRRAPTAAVTPDTVADQPEQAVEISPKSLRAEGIVLRYGNVVAVDDLSFALRPGEIVGLIGPNGAGKTSAVDALTGFVRPSKGRVWLEDTEITSWSVSRRAQAGMRRSFQSLELFEDLTISDNLRVAADRNDLGSFALDLVHPRRQLLTPHARAALQMLDLERDLERRPGELPYGRRRLVAIARALAGAPSVLCLDEPAAGLNSLESRELGELLRRVVNQWQIAVLLIEHDVDLVMNVCDRVLVLDYGHLIASGTPAEVRENEAVIASYLGTGGIDPRADADDGVSEPDSRQVTR
jgi:sulfate-transporting ATPase